jgi:drug/metabolite transporter (DMT)-like permease
MLWGYLFLHETVGMSTLAGGAVVLVAMALVRRFGAHGALLASRQRAQPQG